MRQPQLTSNDSFESLKQRESSMIIKHGLNDAVRGESESNFFLENSPRVFIGVNEVIARSHSDQRESGRTCRSTTTLRLWPRFRGKGGARVEGVARVAPLTTR